MRCVYCDEEISVDEEAWSLREPQPKCDRCRQDPARVMEHIRRKGGFGAVFGEEKKDPGTDRES